MRVLHNYGVVRVVVKDTDPTTGSDVFVQRRVGDRWQDVRGYNSLSDDYAYTNANEAAKRLSWR
jgi:hypothetical protein